MDAFEAFLTPLTAAPEPQPFLAVLWFHTVHVPYTTLPQWRQLYEGDRSSGGFSQDEMDYFGDISAMDAAIGRLRALLRSQGVADDTIVAFSVRRLIQRDQMLRCLVGCACRLLLCRLLAYSSVYVCGCLGRGATMARSTSASLARTAPGASSTPGHRRSTACSSGVGNVTWVREGSGRRG